MKQRQPQLRPTAEEALAQWQSIRDALNEYQHCFVFSVDNMRNTYLKTVRQELSDSR